MWSLRDNNNYEETGLLVSLDYFANNRQLFLENFYTKAKRSIEKADHRGAGGLRPARRRSAPGQRRPRCCTPCSGSTWRSPGPRRPSPCRCRRAEGRAGGRGGRGGAGANAPAPGSAADTAVMPKPQPTEARTFPAGSYVIRMDQPYSRIADALLDYQYWAPNDPQTHPYDDTGWTFPEGFGVESVRVIDTSVLEAPMERVTGDIVAPGGVHGSGSTYAIVDNADNALVTLRYQLKDADFQAAEEPFEAAGQQLRPRVAHREQGGRRATLDAAAKALGIQVYALASAPSVKTHPARAPRVAILHTWQGTQTEGWWRLGFDKQHVPYDYISTQVVAKDAEPEREVRRHRLPAGRRQRAVHHRRDAHVAEPHPVEEDDRDAEPRRPRQQRRHPPRPGLGRPAAPARTSWTTAACSSRR